MTGLGPEQNQDQDQDRT